MEDKGIFFNWYGAPCSCRCDHCLLTSGELACYLSTQSNMIASIESGRETAQEALAWLMSQLTPFFSGEKETFPFGGSIWFLKRQMVEQELPGCARPTDWKLCVSMRREDQP